MNGSTTVDGYDMYFHLGTGRQAKGELVDIKGKVYYFDKDNGRKVKDTTFDFDGKTYVADQSGVLSITAISVIPKVTGTMSMTRVTSSLVPTPLITSTFISAPMVFNTKAILLLIITITIKITVL